MARRAIDPGIYFDLPEDVYHEADGLSCSGMKHLGVSPLFYWHRNLNPAYERGGDTAAQRFGKAAHCLGLEPDRFDARYALKLSPDDFPDALVTADDMKNWLQSKSLPKTGKRKQDLIDRILSSGHPAMIWDLELERHAEANAGKTFLGSEESELIKKAAAVIAADPYANDALTGGMPEVSFFVRDPETGVMLKARMDYVRPDFTIDLKTFSNSRGKAIGRTVNDAVYYESYHLQCVFYQKVRELARGFLASGEIQTYGHVPEAWRDGFLKAERHGFAFVFIESSEPFHLDVLILRRAERPGSDTNVYWLDGEMRIDEMVRFYAECREKFGEAEWRDPAKPRILEDADIPQLLFAGR